MKFELPPLPYSEAALDPYLSARTVHEHYEKHHAGYLHKLTTLLSPTTGAQVRRQLADQAKRVRGYIAPKSNGAAHAEHS